MGSVKSDKSNTSSSGIAGSSNQSITGNESSAVSGGESFGQGSSYGQGTSFGEGSSFDLGSAFGLSGGGSSQSGSSSSQQNVYGAQEPALGALYAQAQRLLGGNAGQGTAGAARDAWLQQIAPGASNPYFGQSVQAGIDQATDSFKRQVLPELDARGAGAQQYGMARDNLARGEAGGIFGAGLAQSVAQQYAQQYGFDQQRQAAALGQAGAIQNLEFAPGDAAARWIGGPTVLGSSSGSTSGTSSNFGRTGSQNLAGSNNRSGSQNTSGAQNTSGSSNFSNASSSGFGSSSGSSFGINNSSGASKGYGLGIGGK